MGESQAKYGIGILVLLVIFVVMTIATYELLTKPHPGHSDFLSRWEGARSFWIDGLNPYGEEASLNIQMRMYGRPAESFEDQVYFAYPMYTAILIAPLVLFNYSLASAMIMVLMAILLVVALFLLLDLFEWKPAMPVLVLLIISSLFNYFPARGLILGQLGLISYVMYAIAFWSLDKERDRLAGIVLAIATIKPQLGFLIIPYLLFWGLRVKRWQFVASFVITLGILCGLSFILVPTWLTDMWQQVTQYTVYAPPSAGEILFERILGLPDVARYIFYAVLWLLMFAGWFQVLIQGKSERAMWVAMITLTITNVASPAVATPHFAVFFILLMFYLKKLSEQRWGNVWVILLLLFLLIEPWARFLLTIDLDAQFENAAWMTYPEITVILISLWLTRHLWWSEANVLTAKTTKN